MAFAVANHIRGDLATAEDILTKYAATVGARVGAPASRRRYLKGRL
jgi:hypothetical protein